MFSFSDNNPSLEIGARNAEAVRETLRKLNIPILAEDLGGKSGRTMSIEAYTGKVYIKTVGKDTKEL